MAMNSLGKLVQCLSWFVLIIFLFFSHSSFATPRLGRFRQNIQLKEDNFVTRSSLNKDVKILYYPQTLDHFNYQPKSYMRFKQKYMIYSKHWEGAKANSPIFVFLGDEQPMDDDEIDALVLPDYAAHFNALLVIIEHRFYGESIPFGMSMEEVVKNASVRGYFNSAQALADFAELILHLKESFNAHYSPVIVFGGSYGGMLASWFRLKYPHIALGAVAASAPVLYFDNISPDDGYYSVVNRVFKEASGSCYETIKKSWAEIDRIGSLPNGLSLLSKQFNTCKQLNNTGELKYFLEMLYDDVAQYSKPSNNPSMLCEAIDDEGGRNGSGTHLLSRIYAAVVTFFGHTTRRCYDTKYWDIGETSVGYAWQTCSEMVMPIVRGTSNESMFPPETFILNDFIKKCKDQYNVLPRPHWITSYYGGHDMKLILRRFGSNIIFSNGLKDPYSTGGVLENLSDSIIALHTLNGSHCMDIESAHEDDPEWLINQRKREVDIIDGWIKNYYSDLKNYLKY